jgi:hypothetical protein
VTDEQIKAIKERLARAAYGKPWQGGMQRPAHSDTLILWPAVFTASGDLVAYANSAMIAELIAHAPADIRALLDALAAARHEAAQQAKAAELWRSSHQAASLTVVQQAEELARLRAERDAAQARAERLAAERREGIAREARLALTVERLAGALQAALGTDAEWWAQAHEALALTTSTAPDAAPAALLQAARAVLAEVAAREGLKQAYRHDAPPGSLREAAETHGQAERALDSAADALRAAGLAGEGE